MYILTETKAKGLNSPKEIVRLSHVRGTLFNEINGFLLVGTRLTNGEKILLELRCYMDKYIRWKEYTI